MWLPKVFQDWQFLDKGKRDGAIHHESVTNVTVSAIRGNVALGNSCFLRPRAINSSLIATKLRQSYREEAMLSAHHFWTEFKFMCLVIACAVMIGFLSASGAADGDQGAAQLGVEQPADNAK
jgi:hypothetical protein